MSHRPYTGPSGRTRVERVRVFRVGRKPVEVEVFRVVNVKEHPELRERVLGGTLHRLDDGEIIAVPFVYHDPEARQLILVIPHEARGREQSERAKLLESFMKEHGEEVPEYARQFVVLYGSRALRDYVEDAETIEVDAAELEAVDERPVPTTGDAGFAGLLPAAGSWARASTDLASLIDGGELWVFAEVEADGRESFSESSSDLLIQLQTIDRLPICILTLIDRRTLAVRRAYLDPRRDEDRRVLELLGSDFHAMVVVHNGRRQLVRSFRLEAPRAANAKMILERTEVAPEASLEPWEEAVDACRSAPLLLGNSDHPFALDGNAQTASEALARLERLEAWSSATKIEEALLALSVPRTVFELSRCRVMTDALRFGLAMSDELILQAVRFGLAPSEREMAAMLQRRFEEIVPAASEQGLDELQIRSNREALERLTRLYGTSTTPHLSCTMEHSR
ncbi:MAG: CpXC domain-containing protein [Polyangiales bacterium]